MIKHENMLDKPRVLLLLIEEIGLSSKLVVQLMYSLYIAMDICPMFSCIHSTLYKL